MDTKQKDEITRKIDETRKKLVKLEERAEPLEIEYASMTAKITELRKGIESARKRIISLESMLKDKE